MTEASTGPCQPWCTALDIELAPDFNPDEQIEPTVITDKIVVATNVLYQLVGKKFPGLCQRTVRPIRCGSWNLDFWSSQFPYMPCSCGAAYLSSCSCRSPIQIQLGAYPIASITSVKVDGVTLPSSSYRLDDYRYLVRLDGNSWPSSQDLTQPTTANDTFEVTFEYGTAVPVEAKEAAATLALQLAKAYSKKKCKLPARVQSVQREGIDISIVDTFEYFNHRKTGLFEVDLFLTAHNPKGRSSTMAIASPDVEPIGRRAGT